MLQVNKSRKRKKHQEYFIAYLFLVPALVLFITFFYLPSFAGIYYSFTEYDIFSSPNWIGLDNYVRMFHDPVFIQGLENSLKYFIIMVPSLVVLPLFIAILVNNQLRGITLFRLVYYLPVVTPMVAVSIGWIFIYNRAGILNSVLNMIGFNIEIDWLNTLQTSLPAVAAVEVWKMAGYFMIIYLAGLQAVQKNLVEAAKIDGANSLRVLWHIYIPQLRPIIAITLVFSTLLTIRSFTSIFVMTGGGPLNSTLSIPLYIYQKAFVEMEMGYASAMGMVLWVILIILTFFNLKFSRGWNSQ